MGRRGADVVADRARARYLLVGFALEPIPHGINSGGELDEERGAEDGVRIVIAPRLGREGHSAQKTPHSSFLCPAEEARQAPVRPAQEPSQGRRLGEDPLDSAPAVRGSAARTDAT